MRKNIIVGNWKMNLNQHACISLVESVINKISLDTNVELVFAPSFIHLSKVVEMCSSKLSISVAAQDSSVNLKGAFTGEVSCEMIASYGVKYVILGHSERRANFNEDNKLLYDKVEQALTANLDIIFCCGESLDHRRSEKHFEWVKNQISDSLFNLSAQQFSRIIIAYEPIWAIGTGVTASAVQAQEMHFFIRNLIQEKYGSVMADNVLILYGGSCNADNAVDLFQQEDIDGGLIGGASLDSASFVKIANSF